MIDHMAEQVTLFTGTFPAWLVYGNFLMQSGGFGLTEMRLHTPELGLAMLLD